LSGEAKLTGVEIVPDRRGTAVRREYDAGPSIAVEVTDCACMPGGTGDLKNRSLCADCGVRCILHELYRELTSAVLQENIGATIPIEISRPDDVVGGPWIEQIDSRDDG